jgi:hypothetical protein
MTSLSASSLPSERKFGVLFAVIFTLLAAYAVYSGWRPVLTMASIVAALAFGITAFVAPQILAPLNRLWFELGILLGKIVSPIVLGIIFFGLITPVGIITRLCGRDELRLRRRVTTTYWVERAPAGPEPESFKNQY